MNINTEYLYELLPAYYREVDAEQGGPLEAVIALLAREGGIVEAHITQLYENWFIETCEEWVVPYIGDLLGVKGVHEIDDASVYSRRAYIANTLAYRRRKGTAAVVEQLAMDITGWQSKAVEFFQLLSTTQHLNHIRLQHTVTPHLRHMDGIDRINTAFDTESHTIDVRQTEAGHGRYNIMNLGVYLWRLESYPMKKTDARLIFYTPDYVAYTYNQLGLDMQLFNTPRVEKDIVNLAEEIHVPGLLRRRALYDELEKARQALVDGETVEYHYFGETYSPVFEIFINGSRTPIPTEEIAICNLSTWHPPATSIDYTTYGPDGSIRTIPKAITVAVDPVLGRIAFANPDLISEVAVGYNYGFSGDLGGGPYDRRSSLKALDGLSFDWQVGVSKDHTSVESETIFKTISEAIDTWNTLSTGRTGLITLMDNRTYEEDITGSFQIKIPDGKRLFIIAADWPVKEVSSGNATVNRRESGGYAAKNLRPHLRGNIEVMGTGEANSPHGGALILNGLLIEGKVSVLDGNLDTLQIDHCTLVPEQGGIAVVKTEYEGEGEYEGDTNGIRHLRLNRSICGEIRIEAEDAIVTIEECIIDHKAGFALCVEKGQLAIDKSTIYGGVTSQSLDASNCIFNDVLKISRQQLGCVRFSYVPDKSITPRRYRCQPEFEIQTQIKALEALHSRSLNPTEKQAIRDQVLSELIPVFNARDYGHHAYSQLGEVTPEHITTGGDNGSEMGAFNYLQQPQREANLHIALQEYVRLGLQAGIIYVT